MGLGLFQDFIKMNVFYDECSYEFQQCSNLARINLSAEKNSQIGGREISRILNFQLKNHENIDEYTKKLQEEYSAQLDGEIQKDEFYEVATLRSEDGQMVSLIKANYQEEVDDEDLSTLKQESMLDPRQQEIRRLLESLKL